MAPRDRAKCVHPAAARSKKPGGKVSCDECGRTFTPRNSSVRHGTYRGYGKHRYQANGAWMWPITGECGCREAGKAYRQELANRPVNAALRKARGKARQRAFTRMRGAYPSIYAQFYREEIEADNNEGGLGVVAVTLIPPFDDVMARLVKEALGIDEHTLVSKVKGRIATPRERDILRYVTRLRVLFSNLVYDRGAE